MSAKTVKTKIKTPQAPASRKLQEPKHRTFRLSKKINNPQKIPKATHILHRSLRHLWKHKRVFIGITAIFLILNIVLVKGLSATSNVAEIKAGLEGVFSGTTGQLATGFALFGLLVGNVSGVNSDVAGVYQNILLIIVSLALIWALRQTHAGSKILIRESFYRGMYPLIPFLLVLLVIGLQLLPLAIASWLFNTTVVSGLAVTAAETVLWSVLTFLFALLSIYMVSSSVFALYISTLPDMTPMKALRSARGLVLNRRWVVIRKFVFLPLILLVSGAIITIPVLLFLTALAEWLFFVLSMATLAITHSYLYSLYRELL